MELPLAITLGDPAGIGPEIVFKAVETLGSDLPLLLVGDWEASRQSPGGAILDSFDRLTPGQTPGEGGRSFLDVALSRGTAVPFGTIDAGCGAIALASIERAIEAVSSGAASALVTAPIHKQSVALAGSPFPGHTELLAARTGRSRYGHDYAMYFDSPALAVALLTVHVSLRQAIEAVSADAVDALARLVDRSFKALHGRKPRLAAAGLNPHAGEGGMFGHEEERIAEGVARARAAGVDVSGPFAPDTVFHAAAQGSWDAVLAMYHDQGLIAVKTLTFERSVNVTIGLPWLRASVDHGTAFDIAGQGVADAGPMRYAIDWALRHTGGAS